MKFESSLKLKLIYVFRINDEAHRGCVKVGEATADTDNFAELNQPNCKALNAAARNRINQYTQTAGIAYDLLYTECTLFVKNKALCSFNDKEVHSVLERSGVKKKVFDTVNRANEWFVCDLETVKRAIAAVKGDRQSLTTGEVTTTHNPIIFRPEQREAIDKTKKQLKKSKEMLWYAKMRFGKTLSALQVVKEMGFKRTLILTHRPVVDSGWYEDFGKIFYDIPTYRYGSKNVGDDHSSLERHANGGGSYVYFASMQDLRGSQTVGGKFDKNDKVFSTPWDFIIVDEAHEGTQTELGKNVMTELIKPTTKVLRLSGTPFNLLDNYKEDDIYTWDYVMEQRAKAAWDQTHPGDPNPYAGLPTMNIFTYDLGRLLHDFIDEDVAFNFREFFRVKEDGTFIHADDVRAFLNLLTKEDADSCYPFANENYRNIFRHTLWMLPGVKAAKAMKELMAEHTVFQHFTVLTSDVDMAIVYEKPEKNDVFSATEYCLPFVKKKGYFISYKSEKITEEYEQAKKAIQVLGGNYRNQVEFYLPQSDIYRNLFMIEKIDTTPKKYPRKAGLPSMSVISTTPTMAVCAPSRPPKVPTSASLTIWPPLPRSMNTAS